MQNYQKHNWVAYGIQVGPKMSFPQHKIVICDVNKIQMHFTQNIDNITSVIEMKKGSLESNSFWLITSGTHLGPNRMDLP